jgi:hypothetical protein
MELGAQRPSLQNPDRKVRPFVGTHFPAEFRIEPGPLDERGDEPSEGTAAAERAATASPHRPLSWDKDDAETEAAREQERDARDEAF